MAAKYLIIYFQAIYQHLLLRKALFKAYEIQFIIKNILVGYFKYYKLR